MSSVYDRKIWRLFLFEDFVYLCAKDDPQWSKK